MGRNKRQRRKARRQREALAAEAASTGNKQFVIYDGRAEFMDNDDCSIYGIEDTLEEAKRVARDDFTDGVIFEYDVAPDGVTLRNERRVYL